MQKVVGSNPIIRSLKRPGNRAFLFVTGRYERARSGRCQRQMSTRPKGPAELLGGFGVMAGAGKIMVLTDCVFCDRTALREAEVYFENQWCVYASARDPRDHPDVLPGAGILVPKAHRTSW